MKVSKDFGERLKQALKEAGYSQKSASEVLGLSKNAMTNYAGGRIPEAMILYRIAKLCSVSMEWLLTGEGERGAVEARIANAEVSSYSSTGTDLSPQEIEFVAKIRQLTKENRIKVEGIVEGLLMSQDSYPQSRTGTSSRSTNGYEREESAAKSKLA